ncbi:MAG TPA: 16S rRNA (cytosine(967)-C(5))-methyltransferase RsmB [Solirubrobacteraceae bacterium]|jgi:16S rRNA (cytosine967-C5)-methyltransferase|nr:16S rRNA (cytosine(967)-C(5))-methyltransferase RsmB [Solirubrobacteraceae bacterium]
MSAVAPARRVAFAVVRRVFEQGAYADRALHGEARGLDARDRALAMRLAFGTVQRRLTLDHLIEGLARPVDRLDARTLAALRLGLYQLAFLDGMAPHAVVGESVELAKGAGGGHKLVNAVLRRATRELPPLPADDTPAGAAIAHSYPPWLVELWWQRFGAEEARALLRAGNEPGELALRANTLVTTPGELAAALPVATAPAGDELPEGLVVDGPFDAHAHELWRRGAYAAQSRASMLVARTVDPRPGERVLDLCAAPGGKTTHLAALMRNAGEIVAVERHAGRAEALRRTCERMRASTVEVVAGDAARFTAAEPFDRVLVDPPCSGLGTLAGHPDLRWRMSPEAIERLARAQRGIVRAAVAALRPGGTLVLSTCTLSPRENEEQVAAAGLRVECERLVLPHRDATDGFHIARMRS